MWRFQTRQIWQCTVTSRLEGQSTTSLATRPRWSSSIQRAAALSYQEISGRATPLSQSVTSPTFSRGESARTGLERMPTSKILKNLLLGLFFSTPVLMRPGFAVLRVIANSRGRSLSPDHNPLLRWILKPLLYDQFCAGTNRTEISRTRDEIKGNGYSGIILCYGKEIQLSKTNELHSTGKGTGRDREIKHFEDGNLETLSMVESGDWLGIKFTGAGSVVTQALLEDRDPPAEFLTAMHTICQRAATQRCRIWVDAEQQAFQPTIDRWTIDLMRRYNRGDTALVYNTLQAYLKASRTKLREQLALAAGEGWTLAIKLVRGAYIDNDRRDRIHDTKRETDKSYDGIVHSLLSGTELGLDGPLFPRVQLFLAGHNPVSIATAWDLVQSLHQKGELKVVPDFGQLQGMGDVLGCRLLQRCEDLATSRNPQKQVMVPQVYKCLTWGSIQECMQYLFRRAVENSGSTDRMRDGTWAYLREMKRRLLLTRRQ